jgi:hypothetical protein
MPENQQKPVEQRVKSFGFRLKKDFGEEIRKDPSKFKARVMGTLKAVLPTQRLGRKADVTNQLLSVLRKKITFLKVSEALWPDWVMFFGKDTNRARSRFPCSVHERAKASWNFLQETFTCAPTSIFIL